MFPNGINVAVANTETTEWFSIFLIVATANNAGQKCDFIYWFSW